MDLKVLTAENSVGQWASCSAAAARTLADAGLDICCGGNRALVDACREKKRDPADVMQKVMNAHAARNSNKEVDPAKLSISDLIRNIVVTHHMYLREALPRIESWIEKMVKSHGDKNPSFTELLMVFRGLHHEMRAHMDKEENVLFPMAEALDRGIPASMNLMNPVSRLEQEHQETGMSLERIKALTNEFSCPFNACTTWRATYSALAELDDDMRRHVHKENNILFPRILAKQAKN